MKTPTLAYPRVRKLPPGAVIDPMPGATRVRIRLAGGAAGWWCNDCPAWLPEALFRPLSRAMGSVCGIRTMCRKCEHRRKQTARRRKRGKAGAWADAAAIVARLLDTAATVNGEARRYRCASHVILAIYSEVTTHAQRMAAGTRKMMARQGRRFASGHVPWIAERVA